MSNTKTIKYLDIDLIGSNSFEMEDGRKYYIQDVSDGEIGQRRIGIHHGQGNVPSEYVWEQYLIYELTPKYYDLYVKTKEITNE